MLSSPSESLGPPEAREGRAPSGFGQVHDSMWTNLIVFAVAGPPGSRWRTNLQTAMGASRWSFGTMGSGVLGI